MGAVGRWAVLGSITHLGRLSQCRTSAPRRFAEPSAAGAGRVLKTRSGSHSDLSASGTRDAAPAPVSDTVLARPDAIGTPRTGHRQHRSGTDVLRQFGLLDPAHRAAIDSLTVLAVQVSGARSATVSVEVDDREWTICQHGEPVIEAAVGGRGWVEFPLIDVGGATIGVLRVIGLPSAQATGEPADLVGRIAGLVAGELRSGRRTRELEGELNAYRTMQLAFAANTTPQSEGRWRLLFDDSPVGIGLTDENDRLVAANPALCALFGRSQTDVLGRDPAEFTHPDDVDEHRNQHVLLRSGDRDVVRIEKRYVHPDGHVRWAWLTVAKLPGPNGEQWTLAHVQDVTDRMATEQAVKDSEANLSAVAEVVQLIQSGADPRQTIVDAGRELAAAAFVGLLEPDEDQRQLQVSAVTDEALRSITIPLDGPSATSKAFLSGQPIFIPDPSLNPKVSRPLIELIGARSVYVVPVRSGELTTAVLVVGWMHPVRDLDDRRAAVITLLADQAGVALRQVALLAELENLALTDPLTSLPNRRSWDQTLSALFDQVRASNRPLSVALIDLDHFKIFNDTHGHAAGDDLLREFAEQAQVVTRSADTVARWGGEEFAVALPNCPSREAAMVLERIRSTVPRNETCSIGCATWDGDESADALMERIDKALYAAKRAGRNRIQHAAPAG